MKNLEIHENAGSCKKGAAEIRFIAVLLGILLSCMQNLLNAQINYVRTWNATAPRTSLNALPALSLKEVKQTTQYIDGLGRPIQIVAKQGSLETGSGMSSDLVTFVGYDSEGRENKRYMPYLSSAVNGAYKSDALTEQPTFYNSSTSPISGQNENGVNAHTLINFEPSPLNRPILQMAAGNSWVGSNRGIQVGYWNNTAADDVRMWTVTDNGIGVLGTYTMTGAYPTGKLFKTITTDENGNQVVEFKDTENKVVLRKVQKISTITDNGSGSGHSDWICTYYIYDYLSNLRAVIQPSGVSELVTNGWTLTATVLSEQCFRYEYDQRNRMIVKQVPGADVVYMIYDARNRLIMTQDANLRASSPAKWLVTVYDNTLDRPVQTGLWTSNTPFTYLRLSAYSNIAFPDVSTNFELLTQTHYDDYLNIPTDAPTGLSGSLKTEWNSYFVPTDTASYPYPEMPVKNVITTTKGFVTWVKKKAINSTPEIYLTSVSIYDERGRVIQTQSQNISGGIDVNTIQYNWASLPLTNVQSQKKAGTNTQTTVTVSQMFYDDLGRLVQTTKRVSNSLVNNGAVTASKIVSSLEYDVLGQLKTKKLGVQGSGPNPLDKQEFEYNIRGWLLGVNRNYVRDLSTASSAYNSGETFTTPPSYSAGNYFGFELGYDRSPTVGSSTWTNAIQYNGNITGTVWKSVHDGQIRKYDFGYDPVNRLINASFNQYTGSTFNKNAGIDFSVNNLSYDANGNIISMSQYGLMPNATSSSPIDLLNYTYQSGSNKLQQVTDGANDNASSLGDFKYDPAGKTGTDYTYTANGSLYSDANKKISSIQYNHLNLPQTITVAGKGTINYIYDAEGNKLQKKIYDIGTGLTTITAYIGGNIYKNDELQSIAQEEGRIRINNSNTGYIFDFFLKDHLGNIRMTITDDVSATTPVVDATSYYPYGLTMAGISSKAAGKLENRKQYNGIEHTTDLGLNQYDAFFRNLDPQVGRFWQVDPETDNQENESPYESMGNNPISNVDPLGDFKTRFGAWWHSLWHGGKVGKNSDGEYYVSKPIEAKSSEGGSVTVGVSVTYGKERHALSAAGEMMQEESNNQAYEDRMVRLGAWQRHETVKEANEATFKNSVSMLLPNVIKAATNTVNAAKEVTAPKGWITQASKKGGGTVFKDPSNPHNIIRQMPGNPNSPNVLQQNPYVKFMKEGKFYDVNGKVLPNGNVPDAHIPLNQFNINNMPKF